jgi:hypothetical protein
MEQRVSKLETNIAVLDQRERVSENRIADLETETKYLSRILLKMQGVTTVLVIAVPLAIEVLTK